MKEIIVASTNQGKIKEIRAMLSEIGIDVKSISDVFDQEIDIEENGQTFKENALIKAQTICDIIHKPTLADDSGLEVNAMDGGPGIYSARFMGHDTSYDIKNQAIIDACEGKDRGARFVCAMALAFPDGKVICVEGEFHGLIDYEMKGTGGFGYDVLFYLPEYGMTSAEISAEEKNKISHRSKALNLIKEKLQEIKD